MRHAVRFLAKCTAIRRFTRAEQGQDLVEYGLLAALISIFAIGAVTALGQQIYTTFWESIVNNF